MSNSDLIALGGLILAAVTSLIGAVLWYSNAEKKRYGTERDFQHLRRNQEQIAQAITMLNDEISEHFERQSRELLEIRVHLGLHKFNREKE